MEKISMKVSLTTINHNSYFPSSLVTNSKRIDIPLYTMIYYINNQPYIFYILLTNYFKGKWLNKTLSCSISEKLTYANPFPTAYEPIRRYWTWRYIKRYIISSTNQTFYHILKDTFYKVSYWPNMTYRAKINMLILSLCEPTTNL